MAQATVGVLPWVKIESVLRVGPWELWPNVRAQWMSHFGRDLSHLLHPYRVEQPAGLGLEMLRHWNAERAAERIVITHESNPSPSRFMFEDLVVLLSTSFWMFGERPSSTAWFLDVFTLPEVGREHDAYARPTKFGVYLATPSTDRILAPTGELFPRVNQFVRFPHAHELAHQLAIPREQSFLGAAEHWHRARRSPIEGTNPFEDIERLWSGFEAFFGVGRDVRDRSTVVTQHVLQALPDVASEHALAEPVGRLLDKAYLARCAHSHGASLSDPMLDFGDHHASIFHVGLDLAEALIRSRIGIDPGSRIQRIRARLLGPAAVADAFAGLRSGHKESVWPGEKRIADALRLVSSFSIEDLAFRRPQGITTTKAESAVASLLLGILQWARLAGLAVEESALMSELDARVGAAADQSSALEAAGDLLLSEYWLVRTLAGGQVNAHGLEIGEATRALNVLLRFIRG